jgi:hypothetical protein
MRCNAQNGTPFCRNSSCEIECNPGTLKCNDNCVSCVIPTNAKQVCSLTNSANCEYVCNQGYVRRKNGTCELPPQWTQHATSVHPEARGRHAMAFDAARGKVVLFGGRIYGSALPTDTWEWDGASWQKITPTGAIPRGRVGHTMVYQPQTGKILMFGGFVETTYELLQDTWEWDGATWTQVVTNTPPPARREHAAIVDGQGKMVVFGGTGTGATPSGTMGLSDTWELTAGIWSLRSAATMIGTRNKHQMVYDSVRSRAVMFGGFSWSPPTSERYASGTWEFDGVSWAQQQGNFSIADLRYADGHAMVFDSSRNVTVLFGGELTPATSSTWEWDGVSWVDIPTPGSFPSSRRDHAMAFDSTRNRVVMFGGYSLPGPTPVAPPDVWEYGP